MSDADPSQKKSAVPSWQLQVKDEPATEDTVKTPRAIVIGNAKKFLEDDEVRDASTDKKITFLESKGLESAEIETLLGVTRNTEATASPNETSTNPAEPQSAPAVAQTSQPQAQTRDTPPIITYPEFLTAPIAPSPLVTRRRLLATIYAFAGLSALIYGSKTYLVTPMLEQLTESRLSLHETAKSNLQRFVLQLQNIVSEIPMTISEEKKNGNKDEESDDEDPNELFHRDVGVQTSRPPTPSNYLHPSMDKKPVSTVEEHSAMLKTMNKSLSGLAEEGKSEENDVSDLSKQIGDLRDYLDGLAYVVPSWGNGPGGYGAFSAQGTNDDEISRVKASIRGVKGVLLSARTFPAATRTR